MELLIVLGVLGLLAAMLMPSLSAVKEHVRLTACAAQMRGVGVGLHQYATGYRKHLPPFAFSDLHGNLPLSGHWGGWSQRSDPSNFGRDMVEALRNVNLWRLVADRILSRRQLICPGSDCSPDDQTVSYFPHTSKFSTYCLRMLYSSGLFREAPELAGWRQLGLLGIYKGAGGGVEHLYDPDTVVNVPCVRLDLCYRETDPIGGEQRQVDPIRAAMLADTFWYRDYRAEPEPMPDLEAYEVRAGWCHRDKFNVLFGRGDVQTIRDAAGTIAANALGGRVETPDQTHFATHAIRVWRCFEDGR